MARSFVREARTPIRRAANISLDSALIDDAKELGINISRACEEGLAKQIAEERGRRWLEENRAAIESSNAWVAEHGLPLAKYRQF
ncbi:MAG: Post-segregation antitoxin (ccd killing mechanism protein) encoded by the plasmid [Sphingomonas bacterium]|uniref:type II toxin-antitoxin system CcdA family antitoxin n=1 Tax=Sphingomonas bacterium TaxID=1895847 RepID=UPI0026219098|nr:type II toxin-antitoxin system CcdA family antitoxin [Sphingomonas bacterium]MDB5704817.1 Post-segregation antitoxin (ccd killing mechanism protein) encoded by the plasmid [Sphingomonas bacterium]